jgi:hypothetical protein
MKNVFIITATNPEAQLHIKDTIERAIPRERVEKFFSGRELEKVKQIGLTHGYYAWGAVPGPRNVPTWEKMQIGDYVLVYQTKTYTYLTKVLFKEQNELFAVENWGRDPDGKTWEYMYFLDKPVKLSPPVPAEKLSQYFYDQYRGFTQIPADRISRIEREHGSLESYFQKVFSGVPQKPIENIGVDDIETEDTMDPILSLLEKKKQVILYGPPGTGKTFNTKRLSMRFLEND